MNPKKFKQPSHKPKRDFPINGTIIALNLVIFAVVAGIIFACWKIATSPEDDAEKESLRTIPPSTFSQKNTVPTTVAPPTQIDNGDGGGVVLDDQSAPINMTKASMTAPDLNSVYTGTVDEVRTPPPVDTDTDAEDEAP